MQEVSLKTLLEAGCHFGHRADRWHPKAATFIYQKRDGIHVIDLVKTKAGLDGAAQLLRQYGTDGKVVLFIGTKRQASPIIKTEAEAAGAAYINKRWIGGFLTNWEQVHKNLEKIRRLTEEQKNNSWKKYPKHERVKLGRYLAKLNMLYSGVVPLTQPPDAVVVIDIKREDVAVKEAKRMNIPVIGVVDTNADPSEIDYVIPSNDDAVGAIELLVQTLAQAYKEGKETRAKEEQVQKAKEAKSLQMKKTEGEKTPASKTQDTQQEVGKPVEKVETPREDKPKKNVFAKKKAVIKKTE